MPQENSSMLGDILSAGNLVYLIIAAACSYVLKVLNGRISEIRDELKEERERRISNVENIHAKIENGDAKVLQKASDNGERISKLEGKNEKS